MRQTVSFRIVSGLWLMAEKLPCVIRHSTRPYQHVLEPLGAYLMIAGVQYQDSSKAGSYNVGPGDEDCITTGELADLSVRHGRKCCMENLYQVVS